MNKTVRDNDTVQFTFFLVMRWNIITAKSCGLLIVILVLSFFMIKALKWTEETSWKRHLS